MKRMRFSKIIILILFLLSSCTPNQENIQIDEKDLKMIPSEMELNSNIVFFNNQNIYYLTDNIKAESPDLMDQNLFEYNLKDKKSKKISTFPNISVSSGSKVIYQNNFYMPLATNTENILIKVDTEKNSSEIVKTWDTFPPLAYVYTLENYLIQFGPRYVDELTTEYYINKINLATNKEENIITKKINNKKGETISCIDVDEKFIYAFSITSTGSNETYNIIQYDLSGKQCNIYPFDLKSFLNPARTLIGEDDAISNLYKEKDYFILNTLGGRVFIFKMTNNKLKPIKIPEKFYKNNPAGFDFLEYYDGNSDFAYFINTFEQNNIVIVFNYLTGKFTSLELPKDIENQYNYYRNADGDLIVSRIQIRNINQVEYYYIDLSKNEKD